jgi:hypothetical protein
MSVLAVAQWIHIWRLSLVNKGALPYIPLHAGYRSEKQSLTHIWLLVISLATSSSVLHDRFQVLFLLSFHFLPSLPLLPTTTQFYYANTGWPQNGVVLPQNPKCWDYTTIKILETCVSSRTLLCVCVFLLSYKFRI